MQISLDGITAQYLVDSGVSERMRLSNYRPGGDRFTDAEAMRWFVTNELGLSTAMDRRISLSPSRIVIYTGWDSISATTMRTLLDTEVTYDGRTYVFDSVSCDAETYVEYGQESMDRWMEVAFVAR